MPSTRAGAPPCRGPDIAPTAPDRAAATSAPVDAMTRAVKVDAFMPCSAADVQYESTALTWRGSGSPRQRIMNRSVIVAASSTRRCGTIGSPTPRAAWATKDRAMTDDLAGMDGDRIGLGRRQPRRERIVDQKTPDMPV